jgi:hypothetical protein
MITRTDLLVVSICKEYIGLTKSHLPYKGHNNQYQMILRVISSSLAVYTQAL